MSQSKSDLISNLRILLVFIAILILVLIVTRCVPGTSPPDSGEEQIPGEHYMENQIMLTGEADHIQIIVDSFPEIDGSEGPIDQLEPTELNIPTDYNVENPPPKVILRFDPSIEFQKFPDLENEFPDLPTIESGIGKVDQKPASQATTSVAISFKLYPTNLRANRTEWELAEEVNAFALINQLNAIAEPNYLTNLPIGGSGGDGGSGIVGDPAGGPPAVNAGKEDFTRQWAFIGENGIDLPEELERSGDGVQIAIFDTSPLAADEDINWAISEYRLHVVRPGLRFGLSGSASPPGTGSDPISQGEHGLFVAGLAQHIAQDAEVYLIEVLDVNAQGDVFTLIKAMAAFLNDHVDPSGGLPRTVFNFSLGIEAVRDKILENQAILNSLNRVVQNIENKGSTPALIDRFPVAALEIAIGIAEQRGVVVIAAAGNDGFPNVTQPPASFDEVIGVASSNYDADASCFSNPGDLAGPSGDGTPVCIADTAMACASDPNTCMNLAVISTVTIKDNAKSGYAYWTGTSFSTPMVSGLAALMLNARPGSSPAQIRSALLNCSYVPSGDSKLGQGIIDVGVTMSQCLPVP